MSSQAKACIRTKTKDTGTPGTCGERWTRSLAEHGACSLMQLKGGTVPPAHPNPPCSLKQIPTVGSLWDQSRECMCRQRMCSARHKGVGDKSLDLCVYKDQAVRRGMVPAASL